MSTDPKRVKEIFLDAAEQPDKAARAAYLDRACAGDAALRDRVEALLRSHDPAGSFLGTPAVAPPEPEHAGTMTFDSSTPRDGPPCPEHEESNELQFLTPSSRPDALGRLGHYEVLQVLGRGGFGIVFRAFDETLQRIVAIKVLAPQMAAGSPARKRFLREARSSAMVRHENVVKVYAVEEQPLPYLVMEFVPGETLQQWLDREGPLDAAEVVRIGRQVAEGLAAAHGTGLIHRDIKPANILITAGANPCVKITDFGLARAADDTSMTRSGVVAGTPMYMAPEQASGEALDHRADLFSLGSVLYTMCAGRPPFRADSTLAVLRRVAEDTPRPIREIIPEVPPWLCDVIARLHAKKPADRVATAGEAADLLRRGLAALERPGKSPPLPGAGPAVGRSRFRTRRWAVAAGLLAVVAVLGGMDAAGVTEVRSTVLRLFSPGGTRVAEVDDAGVRMPPAEAAAWERSVAAMPAEKQVEAVTARLKELNPGCDPRIRYNAEAGVVTELQLSAQEGTKEASDISPLRTLTGLRKLNVSFVRGLSDLSPLKGLALTHLYCGDTQVSDLSPLKGMQLTELVCRASKVSDLSPLKGMQLTRLNCFSTPVSDLSPLAGMSTLTSLACDGTPVSDLSPLKGMQLTWLNCGETKVSDLSPLKDMQLTHLECQQTQVSDLSPIKGMPLVHLRCDFQAGRDAEILRSIKTLETINETPAEEFWKEVGAQPSAPDRGAAEYVLGVGGRVRVNGEAGDRGAGGLPREAFRLTSVDLRGNKQVSDAGLAHFKGCKNLESLNLHDTSVSDAGLAHFKDCKNLIDLELGICPRVSDAGLAHFKDCKNWRTLLLDCTQTTDAGLAHFKDCKNLTRLCLGETAVSDAGLARFKDCKHLKALYLYKTKVSDAGLAHFQGCTDLEHLNLNDTGVGDAGLAHFKDCKNLTDVYLWNTKVSDAGLAHFKDCKDLRLLDLIGTKVSDAGLAHLKGCKNVGRLNLWGTKVGDATLDQLKGCKNLTDLDLRGTNVTPEKVKELHQALPKCRVHWDGGVIEAGQDH